jgi:hypothetical protein
VARRRAQDGLLRAAALLLLLWGPAAAPADEAFFLIVFGSQRKPFHLNCTHSSAAFIKATGQGPDLGRYHLDVRMISWLPASLEVHCLHLRPEPGVNLDLHGTLCLAQAHGETVTGWGPFRIQEELYDRAVRQIAHLESGAVRYKAIDTGFPTEQTSNCIHALSDLNGHGRLRLASPAWGHFASSVIAQRFRPYIVDDGMIYPEVAATLGLDAYGVECRDLCGRTRRRLGDYLTSGRAVP